MPFKAKAADFLPPSSTEWPCRCASRPGKGRPEDGPPRRARRSRLPKRPTRGARPGGGGAAQGGRWLKIQGMTRGKPPRIDAAAARRAVSSYRAVVRRSRGRSARSSPAQERPGLGGRRVPGPEPGQGRQGRRQGQGRQEGGRRRGGSARGQAAQGQEPALGARLERAQARDLGATRRRCSSHPGDGLRRGGAAGG